MKIVCRHVLEQPVYSPQGRPKFVAKTNCSIGMTAAKIGKNVVIHFSFAMFFSSTIH